MPCKDVFPDEEKLICWSNAVVEASLVLKSSCEDPEKLIYLIGKLRDIVVKMRDQESLLSEGRSRTLNWVQLEAKSLNKKLVIEEIIKL